MSRRGGLIWPAILVAVGTVALLANAGILPGGALERLADLWPLILIVIGVELVLRGTTDAVTAGRLGMVAVILACAMAVVFAAAGPAIPVGEQTADFSAPLGSATQASLDLQFAGSDIGVKYGDPAAMGDNLYQAHATYFGNPRPTAAVDSASDAVRISLENSSPGFHFGSVHRILDVTLNPKLPWAVTLSGGATHATLDFLSGTLRSLDISGGATSDDITLGSPHGAVGIGISGGANSARVHRPAGTAIRAEVTGGAGSLNGDGQNHAGLGDLSWQSGNYGGSSDRYELSVSGGANSVTVDAGAPAG